MNTGANSPRARQRAIGPITLSPTPIRSVPPSAACEGAAFDVTPPAPLHYVRDRKNGLSAFDPRRCSNERAAEAYRRYLLSHRLVVCPTETTPVRFGGPIGGEHMPFKGHRTCAEWTR